MQGRSSTTPIIGRQWRYWTLLMAIAIFAFALRMGVTEYAVGLDAKPVPEDGLDQLDYESFAHRLSLGQGYTLEDGTPTARRPPGTSFVILPVYWLFGRSYLAARTWLAILSVAVCLASAQMVRRTLGEATALMTAAALAIDPGQFYYAIHFWSEAPYSLALTGAAALTVATLRSNSRRFESLGLASAGLLWGFAVLLRPQTLLLVPIATASLYWLPRRLLRRCAWQLALQGTCLAVMVSPWVARNYVVMGKPALATVVGGFTFYGAHNDTTFLDANYRGRWVIAPEMADAAMLQLRDESAKEKLAWERGLTAVRNHAWRMPQLTLAKLFCLLSPFEPTSNRGVYWAFALSWIAMAPFLFIGIPETWRRDPWLCAMIGGQVLSLLASTVLFYGAARFRHVLDPFFVPVGMVGLQTCVSWMRRRCHESDAISQPMNVDQRTPRMVRPATREDAAGIEPDRETRHRPLEWHDPPVNESPVTTCVANRATSRSASEMT